MNSRTQIGVIVRVGELFLKRVKIEGTGSYEHALVSDPNLATLHNQEWQGDISSMVSDRGLNILAFFEGYELIPIERKTTSSTILRLDIIDKFKPNQKTK